MELSTYVQDLRRELGTITRFSSEDVVRVADQLAEALDPAVRLTLLNVLATAAAEITSQLDDTVVEVRLAASDPEFVVTAVPPHPDVAEPADGPTTGAARPADAEEAGTARVTLRLAERLKTRIEERAAAEGVSVNSWLTRAAARALDEPRADRRGGGASRVPGLGNRISGYARS